MSGYLDKLKAEMAYTTMAKPESFVILNIDEEDDSPHLIHFHNGQYEARYHINDAGDGWVKVNGNIKDEKTYASLPGKKFPNVTKAKAAGLKAWKASQR